MIDLDQYLSRNFVLREFFVSRDFPELEAGLVAAAGGAIDRIVWQCRAVCQYVLQRLRDEFSDHGSGGSPVIILSGYRSAALNQAVGGQANSWHRFPLLDSRRLCGAVDFAVPGLSVMTIAEWLVDRAQFERALIYIESRFVHLQFATGFDNDPCAIYYPEGMP